MRYNTKGTIPKNILSIVIKQGDWKEHTHHFIDHFPGKPVCQLPPLYSLSNQFYPDSRVSSKLIV